MNAKSTLLTTVATLNLLLFANPASRAALVYNWSGSQAIPDNDGAGVAFNFNLSDPATQIADVSVSLNISGGWNGDLYGYLSHGSGLAVLLNRVGRSSGNEFGYGDAGLAITLTDSSILTDIHLYGGHSGATVTATYNADGRDISPLASVIVFDNASRDAGLSVFNGTDPNGDWTFFLADVSGGSVSTLNGFSVNITAVPEPVNVALVFFGLGMVGMAGGRHFKTRGKRNRLKTLEARQPPTSSRRGLWSTLLVSALIHWGAALPSYGTLCGWSAETHEPEWDAQDAPTGGPAVDNWVGPEWRLVKGAVIAGLGFPVVVGV